MFDWKIINDPVFGFITVPKGLLYDIIQHPIFQRLSRIKQLGLTSMVYPGAQHTRFQHSLGAYHLMREALEVLRYKGHFIFETDIESVQIAILLHDIGHGPFSHVLENTLVRGVSHEEISLLLMEKINKDLGGRITGAIQIFKNEYPTRFLHQMVSGQLDMDRMDYLSRDSFFTGVTEGNIGCDRIIEMLNINNDELVVDEKGIYPIENFLTARRSMYWQVYYHKTSVACEKMLLSALRRAKELAANGMELFCSPALHYFLYNEVDADKFYNDTDALNHFIMLDDNDIWTSLKAWCNSSDRILSLLATSMVNRNIFKVKVSNTTFTQDVLEQLKQQIASQLSISLEETSYFINLSEVECSMYNTQHDRIGILYKDGRTADIAQASDLFRDGISSQKVRKYYLSHWRIMA